MYNKVGNITDVISKRRLISFCYVLGIDYNRIILTQVWKRKGKPGWQKEVDGLKLSRITEQYVLDRISLSRKLRTGDYLTFKSSLIMTSDN